MDSMSFTEEVNSYGNLSKALLKEQHYKMYLNHGTIWNILGPATEHI